MDARAYFDVAELIAKKNRINMPNSAHSKTEDDEDMPAEIDFTAGVRGKYATIFPKGSRVVVLDSDVAEVFPTAAAANEALRDLSSIIKRAEK